MGKGGAAGTPTSIFVYHLLSSIQKKAVVMGLAWTFLLLVTAQAGSQGEPNPERIQQFINQFRSTDARKREEAEALLRNMGQAAIPELELAAKDPDPEVASRAAQLIRDHIVRSTLGPELAKSMPGAAQRLIQGDAHTWTEIFLEATDERSLAYPGLRRPDLGPMVHRALDGAKTPAEKAAICERAARWNLISIEAALPKLLTDPDASVRAGAAYSVSVLKFARLAANLRPLLGDENPQVRFWAITAIGAVEAKEYAPQLIALLGDPRDRNQASRVLGRWKTKEAIPFIRNLLKADDAITRDEGIRAFADLGAPETADEILALALHPSGAHAEVGMHVYAQLSGPEGNPKLIGSRPQPGEPRGSITPDARLPEKGPRSIKVSTVKPVLAKLLLSSALALGLSGCGTVFNFGAGTCALREYPVVYGGVDLVVEVFAVQNFPLGLLVALVDLPFSLVADTVTLPYTIYTTATYQRHDPEEKSASGRPPARNQ